MTKTFWLSPVIALLTAAACAGAAYGQAAKPEAKPAAPKTEAKPAEPKAAAKPAAKPAEAKPKSDPTEQAVLLGQFDDWGAYKATPGGKKVCFALAKPTSATTEPAGRPRDPSYAFISTRPSEKVKNEVSVIVGYTQNHSAWVKNAAEEAQMVDAMRKGGELVVKSESGRGTKTTDIYSLKGMAQALEKIGSDAECK